MILNLKLTSLRNSEFVQFYTDLLAIIEKHEPIRIQIEAQYLPLKQNQDRLTEVFKQKQGSILTEEIADLDGRRDRDFVGISTLVEAYTYSYEPEKKEAAIILKDSLKSYTGAARMNYRAETSMLNDLVEKWRSEEELVHAVETLGQQAWLKELDTSNKLFNDRFLARVQETAGNPDVKVKEIRDGMMSQYKTMLNHIKAHATLNGNESYDSLINQMNVLIEEYGKLITGRKAKSDTDSDSEI
ncbi:DUF6261 family protein [Saccharicrinis sp. GN24d3]|uniref:DUF6261 family protein n=1 Tax=Saccharicrinis sp. GN24d3 TaxID=3458416 RepID=UPI004035C691